MEQNYNNALLLYAIYETQEDNKGTGLSNIIEFSDYVNHAIMTYEEFNNGINYLLKNELVNEIDERILVNNLFREWFNDQNKHKKRIYLLKAIEKIQKYLNRLNENNKEYNKTKFTKENFENCVKEYIKIFEKIK